MLEKIVSFLRDHRRPLAFAFLAALVVIIYWPSLYHIARGDQVTYLAELSSRHGFVDTVFGTFDLNRTRLFGAGDVVTLFRPVLYFLLGLEKYFFGYDYFWWQAVALAAHVFVAGAMYALLCRIQGGVFAWLATAVFVFLPVNIEAVVWHHITAYMLFAGFMLMTWRNLLAVEKEPARASRHFAAALGWMALAVFSHEAGVWYLVVIAGYLFWRKHAMVALGALGLTVLSLGCNALDLWWRQINVGAELGPVVGNQDVVKLLTNAAQLIKWFFSSGFFLDAADMRPVSRMMVSPEVVAWPWPWGAPVNVTVVVGAAFLMVLAAAA